ncbi:hypothetical protein EDC56_3242 [Sinobacterium caligoides]|uniref:Uncharacterized protein n=1 Tax=Sinobacterium caligoides TaxID=933926 RepID=A0A3N2DGV6_9GAMM|nr:hypothetical protein [Sinobacterium caligoides]ROR99002.1 hypothetical protein EDC56_3242 [Sinobacterium caligoides]
MLKKIMILLLAVSANSALANYSCTGKVKYLGTDVSLQISNGYGVHRLCSFYNSENPAEGEMCKT